MKLSRLVYLCIKNVNYYDDDSFTYDFFVTEGIKEASNYSDYSVAIHNVYTPLNEAIQRLSDLERIPYKVVDVAKSNISGNLVDLTELDVNIKEVIGVATTKYDRLPFAPYGIGKIRLLRPYLPYAKSVFGNDTDEGLLVEYKEEIPVFNEDETFPMLDNDNGDYVLDNEESIINDYELTTFGINNAMCQYIIEYVQGKLEEQIDPSLANMHLTRAEQYFQNLKPSTSAFNQEVVHKKYGVE